MKVKIIFFDIDGTLIGLDVDDISKRVKVTLNQLRKKGIKLFLATGRAPYMIPHFEGVQFDGALCFNGGYCYENGRKIDSLPLDKNDVKTIVANARKMGLASAVASVAGHGANFYEENLEEYFQISGNTCNVTADFEKLINGDIFQIMVGAVKEQDRLLTEGTSKSKIARWWDRAVDIIPCESGKDTAIAKILSYYGFTKEECMAFGDGGNDLDMIKYAGTGIAMGNAVAAVKEAADYVTDTCERDGICKAIEHFASKLRAE